MGNICQQNILNISCYFAFDKGNIVPQCSRKVKSTNKTEEIKVRVEPLNKLALSQIAAEESLDLSDIVRKALREFISRRSQPSQRVPQNA